MRITSNNKRIQNSMKINVLMLLSFLLIPDAFKSNSYAQSYTIKIMSYNVLEYTPSVSTARKDSLKAVIDPLSPDIFIGIEIQDSVAANNFKNKVLGYTVYSFSVSPPSSAGSYDNFIFYKTALFNAPTAEIVVDDGNWPTYKFVIEHISSGKTIVIYGVHLSSSGPVQRNDEATDIRTSTSGLGNTPFIAVGDFNLSSASEDAYGTLTNTGSSNYLIDPTGGDFGSNFKTYNTMGSLNSRFDFIFNSTSVTSGTGNVEYVAGTFDVVGNSGGSTGAPYSTASDHLPVYAEYIIDSAVPVELISFTGIINRERVELNWETETEVNNYGFDIERFTPSPEASWEKIGFVEGHGNSNSPKLYSFTDSDISQSGSYSYRLKQIDNDGTFEYSDIVIVEVKLPDNFYLNQNYPNPFNPTTNIDFTIPDRQLVTLRIYNSLGQMVCELINEQREAGNHSVSFETFDLPSGIYFYSLITGGKIFNKKMTLLK